MSQSRTTTGIFLVILLAVIGYVLVTLPPRLVEQYYHAHRDQSVDWRTSMWPSSVSAACCWADLLLAILLHIWKNTRQKAADRERRNLNPSEMSGRRADTGNRRQSGDWSRNRGGRPRDAGVAGRDRRGGCGAGSEAGVAATRNRCVRHDLERQVVAAQCAGRAADVSHECRRRHDVDAE